MENNYFILSDKSLHIERLHICTWDFFDTKAAIEIGMEFSSLPDVNEVCIKLSMPFLKSGDKVNCLTETLVRDDDNSKFIFNDYIKSNQPIRQDRRNGAILVFEHRTSLAVLPVQNIIIDNGLCSFVIRNLNHEINNYIRLYIQPNIPNLAIIKKGISKTDYIYDIKINEQRNLPNPIHDLLNEGFNICTTIKRCFCLQVVPIQYNILYLDSNKLKNIRILESEGFNHYLPDTQKIQTNDFLIIFNKSEGSADGSYTFFSEFEKETIGNKQIILAIATNLICSLLFGISTLRDWHKGGEWYNKLPWEYWTTIIILFAFILYLFVPWKKYLLWIKMKYKQCRRPKE